MKRESVRDSEKMYVAWNEREVGKAIFDLNTFFFSHLFKNFPTFNTS